MFGLMGGCWSFALGHNSYINFDQESENKILSFQDGNFQPTQIFASFENNFIKFVDLEWKCIQK